MTSEIAIMNKEAIALAADSAVTMIGESGEKIFTSANKLFTLSKYHPVGVMVYGTANFMRVPWETIIKSYRKKLGEKKFDKLEGYANNFIEFLNKGNPMFPREIQEKYFTDTLYGYLKFIVDSIEEKVLEFIDQKGEITDEEIRQVISQIIEEQYNIWKASEILPSIPKDFNEKIVKKYEKKINTAIKDVLEELPISPTQRKKLKKIIGYLFSKFPEKCGKKEISGVVIAGFGDKEIFPSLISYKIEGILENRLKYKVDIQKKIDFEVDAIVIPFAQSEMVHTFIEGVDPEYIKIEKDYLSRVFEQYTEMIINKINCSNKEKEIYKKKLKKAGDRILKDFFEKLYEYRNEYYINPIMSVVSMLPKDELAAMAESLVSLTSLKRRWTFERETVGGPIDVAIISKGDGFIWIKRKHYFKPELNPQFFENYFREV